MFVFRVVGRLLRVETDRVSTRGPHTLCVPPLYLFQATLISSPALMKYSCLLSRIDISHFCSSKHTNFNSAVKGEAPIGLDVRYQRVLCTHCEKFVAFPAFKALLNFLFKSKFGEPPVYFRRPKGGTSPVPYVPDDTREDSNKEGEFKTQITKAFCDPCATCASSLYPSLGVISGLPPMLPVGQVLPLPPVPCTNCTTTCTNDQTTVDEAYRSGTAAYRSDVELKFNKLCRDRLGTRRPCLLVCLCWTGRGGGGGGVGEEGLHAARHWLQLLDKGSRVQSHASRGCSSDTYLRQ
jgi:hypothetical protein